jgi:serine/threonine-protein kinase
MLTDSDKRAARLAVSKFGVDRKRVQEAARAMQQAQASGLPADLLNALVDSHLLSPAQADAVRHELDKTVIDPAGIRGRASAPNNDNAPTSSKPPGHHGARSGWGTGEPDHLGPYRILRPLGEGGMGTVYLGYDEEHHNHVAIKVLPDHLASSQSYVNRFYREAQSVLHLSHPNIVAGIVVDQDPASGKHYLVLEYVEGQSLHRLLERSGKLSVGDAVHIILDVAHALEHAQSRNIVHRDIKPGNILITTSGIAKLVDLGLAKRTDQDTNLTGARQGFGTPYYMPYEQATDAKKADGRSDIYALGATLYHLVTGQVPFTGATDLEIAEKKAVGSFAPASVVNPNVPAALDRILEKMLARRPEDRYQTASELIVELERSKLAAPVPSFVDQQLAWRDPVVRQRLMAPAQPTQLDVKSLSHREGRGPGRVDVWYLRARNADNKWQHSQATTQQILQRHAKGTLPAGTEAYSQALGEFRPLDSFPEFKAACQKANGYASTNHADGLPPAVQKRIGLPLARWARRLLLPVLLLLLFLGVTWVAFLICSR